MTPTEIATIKAACERMIKQDLVPHMMELHPKIVLELAEEIERVQFEYEKSQLNWLNTMYCWTWDD